jgi:SulP family sulfate permease
MGDFREFIPKSFLCLGSGYRWSTFKKDLVSGVTVGIIALPLSMAFAIASGVTPDRGLYTAIVAGFLISLLGGSRAQIGGPTGAFVVLVYGIVQKSGYEGLALSTLLGAALLLVMGVCKIGSWIKYVPHPLVTGFTTGLAVMVFSSQIKDFFGLKMGSAPADFVNKWAAYFKAFPTFDPTTLLLGVGTFISILLIRKYAPKIQWGISAIILATLTCVLFDLPVETIQSKFGALPSALPSPSLPSLSLPLGCSWAEIVSNGVAIAFLGGIESLLSCVIADGMMGSRHKSNCELVGQGIANLASALFGGIPATGAIARTAVNVKSGAQTPLSGMIHALVLLLTLLCLAPIVSLIPLAALAAVLMMVAWNMSELSHFIHLLKAPAGDVAILATAFLLTIFVDITMAIFIGMILASFLFMKRMSAFSKTVPLTQLFDERGGEGFKKKVPEGVEVYEIQGPFYFGAADLLRDLLSELQAPPKVFILRLRHVPMIDASGMHALKEFYQKCKKSNTRLLLSGVQDQTAKDLKSFGLTQLIGADCIFTHIDEANLLPIIDAP